MHNADAQHKFSIVQDMFAVALRHATILVLLVANPLFAQNSDFVNPQNRLDIDIGHNIKLSIDPDCEVFGGARNGTKAVYLAEPLLDAKGFTCESVGAFASEVTEAVIYFASEPPENAISQEALATLATSMEKMAPAQKKQKKEMLGKSSANMMAEVFKGFNVQAYSAPEGEVRDLSGTLALVIKSDSADRTSRLTLVYLYLQDSFHLFKIYTRGDSSIYFDKDAATHVIAEGV